VKRFQLNEHHINIMAARRAIGSLALGANRQAAVRIPRHYSANPTACRILSLPSSPNTARSFSAGPPCLSQQAGEIKKYTFAEVSLEWEQCSIIPRSSKLTSFHRKIQKLSSNPNDSTVIIDVREPSELVEGFIPGAINIPIKSQPDGLLLNADEFAERFDFDKPTADKEVLFYCRSGVRSKAAAMLARQVGYQKVSEYPGSWLDWEKNGGAK
jgi:rhodanese-related sulfurtransferase